MPLLTVDRRLFCRLVLKLNGNPMFCLHMIALWKWVEEPVQNPTIIPRLLSAKDPELVAVMKETRNVIAFFYDPNIPIQRPQLPQTQRLISESQFAVLNFTLYQERTAARKGICKAINDMLLLPPNLNLNQATDLNRLMRLMQRPDINNDNNPNPIQVVLPGVGNHPIVLMNEDDAYPIPLGNRTLFITFPGGAGNTITLQELKSYFTSRCGGKCIESIRMGRTLTTDEKPWYAQVLFISVRMTRMILGDDLSQSILWLEDNVRYFVAGTFVN